MVAVVGDVIVTQSNLQEKVIQKRQEGVRIPEDSGAFRAFVLGVLNEIVDEELLLQKAKDLLQTAKSDAKPNDAACVIDGS